MVVCICLQWQQEMVFQYPDKTMLIFCHFLPTRPSYLQIDDFQLFLVCCVVAVLLPDDLLDHHCPYFLTPLHLY